MPNIDQSIDDFYKNIIGFPICSKRDKCDKNSKYTLSPNPKMPFIGRNYGKHEGVPKLVFLSLDSGDFRPNYSTIKEIREETEKNPPKNGKGKHWYETFEIAKKILSPYNDEQKSYDTSTMFVHTNSAKCTQSKEGRKQADNELFDNCQNFIEKEIPLYGADIIITQGKMAERILVNFGKEELHTLKSTFNGKEALLKVKIRIINNKRTLHIPLYHPSYYRGYWKQKQVLLGNLSQIFELYKTIK